MSALHALHDPGVVARPDERWGETPCAFITLKADHQHVRESEIIAFCREHLAGSKSRARWCSRCCPKRRPARFRSSCCGIWPRLYRTRVQSVIHAHPAHVQPANKNDGLYGPPLGVRAERTQSSSSSSNSTSRCASRSLTAPAIVR